MTTLGAVYRHGAFHPTRPLHLEEGERAKLTLQFDPTPPISENGLPSEQPIVIELPPEQKYSVPMTIEEWDRRMDESKTYREWMFLMNHCPEPDRAPDDGSDDAEELEKLRNSPNAHLLEREIE